MSDYKCCAFRKGLEGSMQGNKLLSSISAERAFFNREHNFLLTAVLTQTTVYPLIKALNFAHHFDEVQFGSQGDPAEKTHLLYFKQILVFLVLQSYLIVWIWNILKNHFSLLVVLASCHVEI